MRKYTHEERLDLYIKGLANPPIKLKRKEVHTLSDEEKYRYQRNRNVYQSLRKNARKYFTENGIEWPDDLNYQREPCKDDDERRERHRLIEQQRPVSSFDMSDHEEQKRCFHWSNFQPLWAKDNISKHAKLNWTKPESYTERSP